MITIFYNVITKSHESYKPFLMFEVGSYFLQILYDWQMLRAYSFTLSTGYAITCLSKTTADKIAQLWIDIPVNIKTP